MATNPEAVCADFEVSIEMRLQEALPPERARELDTHLSTCGSCRAFAREAGRLQGLLQGPGPAVSTEALLARMRRVGAEDRRRLVGVVIGICATAVLLWASTGSVPLGLIVATLVSLLVLTPPYLRGRRLAAEVARADRGQDELLAVYRRALERRLRRWSQLRVVALAFALFQLAVCVLGPAWPDSLRPLMTVYLLGTAAVCLVRGWYLGARALPTLRRELEELR